MLQIIFLNITWNPGIPLDVNFFFKIEARVCLMCGAGLSGLGEYLVRVRVRFRVKVRVRVRVRVGVKFRVRVKVRVRVRINLPN